QWDESALRVRGGLGTYDERTIKDALRYYVPPDCQQTDPSGLEEPRALAPVDAPLFSTLRRHLDSEGDQRFLILLADSGMGKTSAVINYCAHHLRGWRRPKYGVAAFYLGLSEVDSRIEAVEDKANTILFLDALDEDTRAIEDHRARIARLVELAAPFRALVLTCRSQFFAHDEEIPRETGLLKVGPRRAGEGAVHTFKKLYLSPLSDTKVEQYLRQRYPIWRWKRRRQAWTIVAQVPNLSARPMLLAHVDDLLQHPKPFRTPAQIYEVMVRSWIERERGFVADPEMLLGFSKRLAVDLYLNREKRGSESVPLAELEALAVSWGIRIKPPLLAQRSLLNRDADGNYKFAHRSIMEYLFVEGFLEQPLFTTDTQLTDQMRAFLLDRLMEGRPALYSPRLDETVAEKQGPPDSTAHRTSWEFLESRLVPRSSFHAMLIRMALNQLVTKQVRNGPIYRQLLGEVLTTLTQLWHFAPDHLTHSTLSLGTKADTSLHPFFVMQADVAFSIHLSPGEQRSWNLLTFFSSSRNFVSDISNANSLADALGAKNIYLSVGSSAINDIASMTFPYHTQISHNFLITEAICSMEVGNPSDLQTSLRMRLPAMEWGLTAGETKYMTITASWQFPESIRALQVIRAVIHALKENEEIPSYIWFKFTRS
ncbi:MAG TPA: hypothetical protein VF263_01445, partial [Longimicrobiaceae bacterium]